MTTTTVEPELVSENEFTKEFKFGDVQMFLQKGFDNTSGTHSLLCAIPEIKELKTARIIYPMIFDSEELRDLGFKDFGVENFKIFYKNLTDQIKKNQADQDLKL